MIENIYNRFIKKSNLTIIASRPNKGKTILAHNLIQNVLDKDECVILYSLEMVEEDVELRMLSAKESIRYKSLQDAKKFIQKQDNTNLFIDIESSNIYQIEKTLRASKTKCEKLSLCVIDYIQLFDSKEELAYRLKKLSLELNLPIILVSQLSPKAESRHNKRPLIVDIREAYLSEIADIVIMIQKTEADAEFIIAKSPTLTKESIHVRFNEDFLRFE